MKTIQPPNLNAIASARSPGPAGLRPYMGVKVGRQRRPSAYGGRTRRPAGMRPSLSRSAKRRIKECGRSHTDSTSYDYVGLISARWTYDSNYTAVSAPHFKSFTLTAPTRSDAPFAAVPESSTWAMMALGFVGLGYRASLNPRRAARLIQLSAASRIAGHDLSVAVYYRPYPYQIDPFQPMGDLSRPHKGAGTLLAAGKHVSFFLGDAANQGIVGQRRRTSKANAISDFRVDPCRASVSIWWIVASGGRSGRTTGCV
jgi:hypothetical protein